MDCLRCFFFFHFLNWFLNWEPTTKLQVPSKRTNFPGIWGGRGVVLRPKTCHSPTFPRVPCWEHTCKYSQMENRIFGKHDYWPHKGLGLEQGVGESWTAERDVGLWLKGDSLPPSIIQIWVPTCWWVPSGDRDGQDRVCRTRWIDMADWCSWLQLHFVRTKKIVPEKHLPQCLEHNKWQSIIVIILIFPKSLSGTLKMHPVLLFHTEDFLVISFSLFQFSLGVSNYKSNILFPLQSSRYSSGSKEMSTTLI